MGQEGVLESDEHPEALPFRYVAAQWSIGDRYTLTLEFPDEETMRRELGALGLEALGDTKLGHVRIGTVDPALSADVFGPSVTLTLGPEDRYEFLVGEHHEQARRFGGILLARGTERYARVTSLAEAQANGAPTRHPSPAHRVLAEREARSALDSGTSFTVVVGGRTPKGFRTEVLRTRSTERELGAPPPDVTGETQIRDGATGVRYLVDALAPGAIARAHVVTGKRLDGDFGPVARELSIFSPDEESIAVARRCREVLAALDVRFSDDDATLAACHLQACVESGLTTRLEDELVARALVKFDALSRASLHSPMAIVTAGLAVHQRRKLPCMFDAQRTMREATDLDALFAHVLHQIDLALAEVRDSGRCAAFYIDGEPMPIYAIMSQSDLASLVAAGLVFNKPMKRGGGPMAAARTLAFLLVQPPLDVLERLSHRIVVLPSPDPLQVASGGVAIDGRTFLCAPVQSKLVGAIDEFVLAIVDRPERGLWPIVIDVKARRSSVRDARLLEPGITDPRLVPGGLMFRGTETGWLHLHDIAWSELETSWHWPTQVR